MIYCFNQDALGNLFSIVRQNGVYIKTPKARTIKTSIRSNCIFSLCTSKGCEATRIDENPIKIDPVRLPNSESLTVSSDSDIECVSYLYVLLSSMSILIVKI